MVIRVTRVIPRVTLAFQRIIRKQHTLKSQCDKVRPVHIQELQDYKHGKMHVVRRERIEIFRNSIPVTAGPEIINKICEDIFNK